MDYGKHAYLILAHTHLRQLRTLVSLLDDPRNDIYIHIDRKAPFRAKDLEGVCTRSAVYFVEPRIRVHWGGPSIMRAELALLKAATAAPHAYYHLLSGLDLPLKTQEQIHAFFDAHPGMEFIQCWPTEKKETARFTYYMPFPDGNDILPAKLANKLVKRAMMRVGAKINQGIDFHFSSQWFSITDGFARYIVSREDWLEQVFGPTGTPDEVFVATLLWNSPFKDRLFDPTIHLERQEDKQKVLSGNMRLIDWTRGSARHPWTFRGADWDLLTGTPCLWARKFDQRIDAEVIERLKKHLAPAL